MIIGLIMDLLRFNKMIQILLKFTKLKLINFEFKIMK